MALTDAHPEYLRRIGQWCKCRDVVAGEDAVHAKGQKYLPKMTWNGADSEVKAMINSAYTEYLMRASFYNATEYTVQAFAGMLLRIEPQVTVPKKMQPLLVNITNDNNSFLSLCHTVVNELLTTGRCVALVDYPEDGGTPFIKVYRAEAVYNWQTKVVDGKHVPSQVRIKEVVVNNTDEFSVEEQQQYRVLDLDGEGHYRVRLYNNAGILQKTIVPMADGQPMTVIPIVFFSPTGMSIDPCKPIMLDLVNENLSHYRTTADLESGAHYTAIPIYTFFGINKGEEPVAISPTIPWVSTNPNAKASLLEFTGQGLQALEERLVKKEQHMASLGARMLKQNIAAAESAEVNRLLHAGETNVLTALATAINGSMEKLLGFMRDWMGVQGEIEVAVNRDFLPANVDSAMMIALLKAVQGGSMSPGSFYFNLKRAGMTIPGRDYEEEAAAIKANPPLVPEKPTTAAPSTPATPATVENQQ